MATPTEGGKVTDQGGASGLAARVSRTLTGWASDWFGPGVPMSPVAPADQVRGRRFDYAVTENLNYTPRSEPTETGISFPILRRLAEPAQGGLDLLRLAIETRKDQMAAQQWTISGKEKNDDGGARAKEIEAFLRSPDMEHSYEEWARIAIEDHLVCDAVVSFPRTVGGRPVIELIDPSTIKKVIDLQGRRPLPPLPAYQQILHGVPAIDYTLEELFYFQYNARSNRLYGCSRVEQVVNIINLSLRRALHVLQYYTEGNVPEALVGVPDSWNPDQIEQFQKWWDSLLAGNTAERRHMKFIPGGTTTVFTKEDALKNEFDEWLARIICYAFSLSPETLVKQTNRATAETAKEAAAEEGLEPLKIWWQSVMNRLIEAVFDEPTLCFVYQDEEITDPKVKAEVTALLAGNKPVIDLTEARKMWGHDPATPEQLLELRPPAPVIEPPIDGEDSLFPPKKPADPSDPSTKVGKAGGAGGRARRPGPRDERYFKKQARRIRRAANAALSTIAATVAAELRSKKVAKIAEDEIDALIRELLESLPEDAWADALEAFTAALGDMASRRAAEAFDDLVRYLPAGVGDIDALLEQVNERAVAWAETQGAQLVTDVEDTTREGIRDIVSDGLREGLTNDEIAAGLSENFMFSDARADMIARTETAFAENTGTLIGWRETGVVERKVWLVADADVCPECEALDGEEVGLDEAFSSGDDAPPLHPNCRCTVTAVISQEADTVSDSQDGLVGAGSVD